MASDNLRWMNTSRYGVAAFVAALDGIPDATMQPDDYLALLDGEQREYVYEAATELLGIIESMRGA